MEELKETYGRAVLESLAEIYRQLYLVPGKKGEEEYSLVVRQGQEPEEKNLSHFKSDEKDSLVFMDTPVGEVCVITLNERQDFVTFLQIMANRCAEVNIPDTQGASILSGVINWRKIEARRDAFFEEEKEKGNDFPDWNGEFKRFTSDKSNYLDTLIVLSVGPYSFVPGSEFGFSAEEWTAYSNTIRLYHECTHFICRKKFPEKKDAVMDELVADAVGIYAAFGKFNRQMEERFLGISGGHYTGGRLENYVTADTEEEKSRILAEMSGKVSAVLSEFDDIISARESISPFELAVLLGEGSFSVTI
ncbi:MAG: hypothetical protein K5985_09860 [Lachnospiraceae bacterium]|nr:hypothetical protein [Lachnospiraceae bacterium]